MNKRHSSWFRAIWILRTISIILVCLFFLNSIPFVDEAKALAPWAGVEQATVRIRAHIKNLELTNRLIYADTPDKKGLLELNKAKALLLSHGKLLLSEELKGNNLKLLRAVIHEEIEAIMQIIKDSSRYHGIKDLILPNKRVRKLYEELILPRVTLEDIMHQPFDEVFSGEEKLDLPMDLLLNDIIANAFELLFLTEKNLVRENELTNEEKHFLRAIRPIIMANKHNYFTGEFWDWHIRETKIRVALANGQRFYQVASKEDKKTSIPPSGINKAYRNGKEKDLILLKREILRLSRTGFVFNEKIENNILRFGISHKHALHSSIKDPDVSYDMLIGGISSPMITPKHQIAMILGVYRKKADKTITSEEKIKFWDDHIRFARFLIECDISESMIIEGISRQFIKEFFRGLNLFETVPETLGELARQPLSEKQDDKNITVPGSAISAEKIFSQISIIEFNILAASMIDNLEIGEDDRVLCPSSVESVACAIRGAKVDLYMEQHTKLKNDILKRREQIQELCGEDMIGDRIDTENYRTYIEKANLLPKHYSYIFLLNVLDDYKSLPDQRRIIERVLTIARDNSTILVSSVFGNAQKQINLLKSCAQELGYEIEDGRAFMGKDIVHELKVHRLSNPALPDSADLVIELESFEKIICNHFADKKTIYGIDLGAGLGDKTKKVQQLLMENFKNVDFIGIDDEAKWAKLGQRQGHPVIHLDYRKFENSGHGYDNRDLITIFAPVMYRLADFVMTAKKLVAKNGLIVVSLLTRDIEALYKVSDNPELMQAKKKIRELLSDFMLVKFRDEKSWISHLDSSLGNSYAFIYSPQGLNSKNLTELARQPLSGKTKEPPRGSPASFIDTFYKRFKGGPVTVLTMAQELAVNWHTVTSDAAGFVKAKLVTKNGSKENTVIETTVKGLNVKIVDELKDRLVPLGPQPRVGPVESIVRDVLGSHDIVLAKEVKIGDGTFRPMKNIRITRNKMVGDFRGRPKDKKYRQELKAQIYQSFIEIARESDFALSESKMEEYPGIAANALVRYDWQSLQSLVEMGILTKKEASSIDSRALFPTYELAKNIISILKNYSAVNITEAAQRRLLSNFITVEEVELYKKLFPDVPLSDILVACKYSAKSARDILEKEADAIEAMGKEPEFSKTPEWARARAYMSNKKDPRQFLRKAIREATIVSEQTGIPYYRVFRVRLLSPSKLQDLIRPHREHESGPGEQVRRPAPQEEIPVVVRYKPKGGSLDAAEKAYREILAGRIFRSLTRLKPDLPKEERRDYASIAATTLLEYDMRSINRLVFRKILAPKEAKAIFKKEPFPTKDLARTILSILDGYKRLSIGKAKRKELLANFYTEDEIEALMRAFPVPKGIIISACVDHPNSKIEFLKKVVRQRDAIKSETEFNDIPEWIITDACGRCLNKARERLRRFKAGEMKIFGKTYKKVTARPRPDISIVAISSPPAEVESNQTSKFTPPGSEGPIATMIRNIYDGWEQNTITTEEAATKIMEEVLPCIAYSEENVLNLKTARDILREGLKSIDQGTSERVESVFMREAVEILTRHENTEEQTELREELNDLTTRMFATMVFFATHDWFIEVMELAKELDMEDQGESALSEQEVLLQKIERLSSLDKIDRTIKEVKQWESVARKLQHLSNIKKEYAYVSDIRTYLVHTLRTARQSVESGRRLMQNKLHEDRKAEIKRFEKTLSGVSEKMAAFGYLLLNNLISYNDSLSDLEEKRQEASSKGYTLDQVGKELAATLEFRNSALALKESAQEGFKKQAAEIEKEDVTYEKTGQSIILYADDILQNAVMLDLESAIKNTLAKYNTLKDGKIILFARNPANATILERMIKRADSSLDIVTITEEELYGTKNIVKGNEVKEVEKLILYARNKKENDILAIIRGPVTKPLEDFKDILERYKIPMVIWTAKEGMVYSFDQAIRKAMRKKDKDGSEGWFVDLDPIKPLSKEKFKQYILSLETLQAA